MYIHLFKGKIWIFLTLLILCNSLLYAGSQFHKSGTIPGHDIDIADLNIPDEFEGFESAIKPNFQTTHRSHTLLEVVYFGGKAKDHIQIHLFLPTYHTAREEYAVERFWDFFNDDKSEGLKLEVIKDDKGFEIKKLWQHSSSSDSIEYGRIVGKYAYHFRIIFKNKTDLKAKWPIYKEIFSKIAVLAIEKLQGAAISKKDIPKTLEDIEEFRDFRGVWDKRVSPIIWERWIKACVGNLVKTVKAYPGVHNRLVVPNETQKHIDDGLVKGFLKDDTGDLARLMAMDEIPSENRKTNIYAALTEKTEAALRQEILNSPDDSLLPFQVMKKSLDICKGNYPLAVLTAHAVLKETAKNGRSDGLTPMFARNKQGKMKEAFLLRKKLRPHSDIVKKLRNLRPAGDHTGDKIGPWYHAFGILSVAAISSSKGAEIGAAGEHWLKFIKAFGKAEGSYNWEKETIDLEFANQCGSLREYNRFCVPISKEELKKIQIDSAKRSSKK